MEKQQNERECLVCHKKFHYEKGKRKWFICSRRCLRARERYLASFDKRWRRKKNGNDSRH